MSSALWPPFKFLLWKFFKPQEQKSYDNLLVTAVFQTIDTLAFLAGTQSLFTCGALTALCPDCRMVPWFIFEKVPKRAVLHRKNMDLLWGKQTWSALVDTQYLFKRFRGVGEYVWYEQERVNIPPTPDFGGCISDDDCTVHADGMYKVWAGETGDMHPIFFPAFLLHSQSLAVDVTCWRFFPWLGLGYVFSCP